MSDTFKYCPAKNHWKNFDNFNSGEYFYFMAEYIKEIIRNKTFTLLRLNHVLFLQKCLESELFKT